MLNALSERYPLFAKLTGQFGGNPEKLPPLVAFICALADSDVRQPICVMLPNSGEIARLTAIMLALHKQNISSTDEALEHHKEELKAGSKVRVLPGGFVYEYLGPHPDYPQFIKLKILNKDGGTCTIKVEEITRLQPTEASRPLGDGKKDFGAFERSPLDEICETSTGGNTGLVTNEIFLLGYRTSFETTLEASALSCSPSEEPSSLSNFLPWGKIRSTGSPVLINPPSALGEPLVAVSSDTAAIAAACTLLPPGKGVVVADTITSLVNNLQDYDRITDRQKLLAFCRPQDMDKAQVLRERGALIWEIHPDEAALERDRKNADRNSVFGNLLSSLEVVSNLSFSLSTCRSEIVEKISERLQNAVPHDIESDDAEHVDALVKPMFGMLNNMAEWVDQPTSEELDILRDRLKKIRIEFSNASVWLSPDHSTPLRDTIEAFDSALNVSPENLGAVKGEELLSFLDATEEGTSTALITKTPESAQRLSEWLGPNDLVDVYPIAGVIPDKTYDQIVLLSWPGKHLANRLIDYYLAPQIHVIGYLHECRWFERLVSRFNLDHQRADVPSEVKAKLLSLDENPPPMFSWKTRSVTSNHHTPDVLLPNADVIFDYEARMREIRPFIVRDGAVETREAKFVRFVGSSSAFFTEWHAIPWLNPLIGEGSSSRNVPSRYPNEIQTGDYLLFRDGADKDVIRYVAEAEISEAKYQAIRKVADLWRPALEAIAHDPWVIWTKLQEGGLRKGEAAVRNWVLDPYMIGPGSPQDYEAIAAISPEPQFKRRWKEVWNAVGEIRKLHRRAGHQLSQLLLEELPKHIDEIGIKETSLDLGFGQVWVVQVEFVANDFEMVPYTAINHLIWDEETTPSIELSLEDLDLDLSAYI